MATPLPGPPPQSQPGGMMQPAAGPDPKALLHTAIQALHEYAQAEPDPADRQAAVAIAQAVEQLALKDQQDLSTPGQANYRQGGTAASQFFGPAPRY